MNEEEYQYGRSGNRNGNYQSADYKKGLDDYDKVQKARWAAFPTFDSVETPAPYVSGGGGGGGSSYSGESWGDLLDDVVKLFWPLKKVAEWGKDLMWVDWKICLPSAVLFGFPLTKLAYMLLHKYSGDIGLGTSYIPWAGLAAGFTTAWFVPRILGLVLVFLMRTIAVLLVLALIGLCGYLLYLAGMWAYHTFGHR